MIEPLLGPVYYVRKIKFQDSLTPTTWQRLRWTRLHGQLGWHVVSSKLIDAEKYELLKQKMEMAIQAQARIEARSYKFPNLGSAPGSPRYEFPDMEAFAKAAKV